MPTPPTPVLGASITRIRPSPVAPHAPSPVPPLPLPTLSVNAP